MENIRKSKDTNYVINRAFSNQSTIAKLIESRVLYANIQIAPLQNDMRKLYNESGNSIQ